jgi:ABC-type polar amino acid transport system ATPase subunit
LIEVLDKIVRQPQAGANRHAVQQQMHDFARAVARRVYTCSRGVAANTSTEKEANFRRKQDARKC